MGARTIAGRLWDYKKGPEDYKLGQKDDESGLKGYKKGPGGQKCLVNMQENWWPEVESNHRHKDFQSFALPTELSGPGTCLISLL